MLKWFLKAPSGQHCTRVPFPHQGWYSTMSSTSARQTTTQRIACTKLTRRRPSKTSSSARPVATSPRAQHLFRLRQHLTTRSRGSMGILVEQLNAAFAVDGKDGIKIQEEPEEPTLIRNVCPRARESQRNSRTRNNTPLAPASFKNNNNLSPFNQIHLITTKVGYRPRAFFFATHCAHAPEFANNRPRFISFSSANSLDQSS